MICFLSTFSNPVAAATNEERCEEARAVFKESGVARDAKEGFFGGLQIKPPRSTFPPEMDRVTWWGTFKPFEHWQSPEFEAAWVNPRGEMVERETFRGTHCAMAKTRLDVKALPQGRLEPGMWRVVVSCSGAVIDNHPFAVVGSLLSPVDSGGKGDSGIMIWTDDLNE